MGGGGVGAGGGVAENLIRTKTAELGRIMQRHSRAKARSVIVRNEAGIGRQHNGLSVHANSTSAIFEKRSKACHPERPNPFGANIGKELQPGVILNEVKDRLTNRVFLHFVQDDKKSMSYIEVLWE